MHINIIVTCLIKWILNPLCLIISGLYRPPFFFSEGRGGCPPANESQWVHPSLLSKFSTKPTLQTGINSIPIRIITHDVALTFCVKHTRYDYRVDLNGGLEEARCVVEALGRFKVNDYDELGLPKDVTFDHPSGLFTAEVVAKYLSQVNYSGKKWSLWR